MGKRRTNSEKSPSKKTTQKSKAIEKANVTKTTEDCELDDNGTVYSNCKKESKFSPKKCKKSSYQNVSEPVETEESANFESNKKSPTSTVSDTTESQNQLKKHMFARLQSIFKNKKSPEKAIHLEALDPAESIINTLLTNGNESDENDEIKLERENSSDDQDNDKFRCSFCSMVFNNKSLLTIHESGHIESKEQLDDIISSKQSASSANFGPKSDDNNGIFYTCEECGRRFSTKPSLRRHRKLHTGDRPYQCKLCKKAYIQAGGLKAHMFRHTGENGFKCDQCEEEFSRKSTLSSHKLYVHYKIRPFSCEVCSKCFTTKDDLNRHTYIHLVKKPHVCTTCNKGFPVRSALTTHLLTHIREKPSSCDICNRAFIRKDCLLRHLKRRHPEANLEELGV